MAIRGFVLINDGATDTGDNTKVNFVAKVCVLGDDIGDLNENDPNFTFYPSLAVGLLSTLKINLASAAQTACEGHGIEFGLGDSVVVY